MALPSYHIIHVLVVQCVNRTSLSLIPHDDPFTLIPSSLTCRAPAVASVEVNTPPSSTTRWTPSSTEATTAVACCSLAALAPSSSSSSPSPLSAGGWSAVRTCASQRRPVWFGGVGLWVNGRGKVCARVYVWI